MGNDDFSALCKEIVAKYTNEHLDKSDGKQIGTEDVFYCLAEQDFAKQ